MLNHAHDMSYGIVFLIVFTLAMFVVMPVWPYSKRWGLKPSCTAAFCIGVVLFLLQTGDL